RPLRSSTSGINCRFVIFDLSTSLFFQKRAAKRTLRPFGTGAASLRRLSGCLRESRSPTPAGVSAIRLRILGKRSQCYQHDIVLDIGPLSRELDNYVVM